MSDDLNWLSATKLAKLFKAGKASPVEVAKACLAQVARQDGKVNAMSLVDEKTALSLARASEKRWRKGEARGPLDGVPLLIKDILLVKGWPTLRGSKTVDRNQAWEHDAPSVARLREAGTVFLGMTTTPEFGWKGVTDSPLTGITRNPWNLAKTPGGSSGGSSAGLAAGYAPLALGTDGGGSVRIPAGFTGVYGLKPSFGRVPAWPLSPFGTVAHIGPMTRSVGDSALMLNAMAQPDARDWHALPFDDADYVKKLGNGVKGMRFAYSPKLGFDVAVEPDVARLVKAAVATLREAGAKVVEVDPGFADPAATFRTIWWMGVRGAFGALPATKLALLEPALREVFEQSKAITVEEILEATKQRGLLGSQMRQFMEGYDALLTPTLPITAFDAGKLQPGDAALTDKWVNWTPFSYPFNLTQQPAASVPCGLAGNGLPVGLQIVGRMFEDKKVLRISAAVEKALNLKQRPAGF
ncbi:MAG: amidase [Alphaproteobacteria bacterium]|nr:amidase [Alphaproteobacteria bacterium]